MFELFLGAIFAPFILTFGFAVCDKLVGMVISS
jgi:hypothetical protein